MFTARILDLTTATRRRRAATALAVGFAVCAGSASQAAIQAAPASAAEQNVVEPGRQLRGWQSEWPPAYQCPSDYPYLYNQNYAPGGSTITNGVQVEEAPGGPIGVSVTRVTRVKVPGAPLGSLVTGMNTGNSATNWAFNTQDYQVVLHCTNQISDGYYNS